MESTDGPARPGQREHGSAWAGGRQIDRSKWVALPNVGFRLELSAPENMLRPFIKMMFTTFAAGTAVTFSGATEEVQLVMLCKCSMDGAVASFEAYIPNFAITQFAIDHLPTSKPMDQLDVAFRSVNIQHSYRCPLDVLFPVVIVFRQANRLVLLANANQFDDPEQFLRPQLCRTTSGFLNFLGTLSWAVANGMDKLLVQEKEAAEKIGLNEWLRWLRQLSDHGKWETGRILVNVKDAEEYVYDYPPADQEGVDAQAGE